MKNKKRFIFLLLLLVVVLASCVYFTNMYLRESSVSKYLNWYNETYPDVLTNNEKDQVIAYLDDSPISRKELIVYAMLRSIDANYFQSIDLNDSLQDAEVLQSSFEDLLKDTLYCIWADELSLNYTDSSVQNWFIRVLKTQSNSKTPNIAAKAKVQLLYREDYQRRYDGSSADKLIEEKYAPEGVQNPIELSQHMLELFQHEASQHSVVILESAPEALRTEHYLSMLKKGFLLNIKVEV